jgi:hypothetical protein
MNQINDYILNILTSSKSISSAIRTWKSKKNQSIFLKKFKVFKKEMDDCPPSPDAESPDAKNISGTFLNEEKKLPSILIDVQSHLLERNIECSKIMKDGRINSCLDEDIVVELIVEKFKDLVYKPSIRMWYDILLYDRKMCIWIPVNIKTSTTKTSDNTGNLAMCVYAYTDEDLRLKKTYTNGKMSEILVEKLRNKSYNTNPHKDYYFIVLNKNDNEVIINSVLGLTKLTSNINNLPFQVCWKNNKTFSFISMDHSIKMFIEAIASPKPSWKEKFVINMRDITV